MFVRDEDCWRYYADASEQDLHFLRAARNQHSFLRPFQPVQTNRYPSCIYVVIDKFSIFGDEIVQEVADSAGLYEAQSLSFCKMT